MPETSDAPAVNDRLAERRTNQRVSVLETVAGLIAVETREGSSGLVLNLSAGGMMLQSLDLLETGRRQTVMFKLPDAADTLCLSAVVVWSDSDGFAGLEFDDLLPAQREHIERWVHANLTGETTARSGAKAESADPASSREAGALALKPGLSPIPVLAATWTHGTLGFTGGRTANDEIHRAEPAAPMPQGPPSKVVGPSRPLVAGTVLAPKEAALPAALRARAAAMGAAAPSTASPVGGPTPAPAPPTLVPTVLPQSGRAALASAQPPAGLAQNGPKGQHRGLSRDPGSRPVPAVPEAKVAGPRPSPQVAFQPRSSSTAQIPPPLIQAPAVRSIGGNKPAPKGETNAILTVVVLVVLWSMAALLTYAHREGGAAADATATEGKSISTPQPEVTKDLEPLKPAPVQTEATAAEPQAEVKETPAPPPAPAVTKSAPAKRQDEVSWREVKPPPAIETSLPQVRKPAPLSAAMEPPSPPSIVVFGDPLPAPVPASPPQLAKQPPPEGTTPPKLLRKVYPWQYRGRMLSDIQGTVVLSATIDEKGRPTRIEVVSGHLMLAEAAREAFSKWRYEPATRNGEPVESEVEVSFNFGSLRGRR